MWQENFKFICFTYTHTHLKDQAKTRVTIHLSLVSEEGWYLEVSFLVALDNEFCYVLGNYITWTMGPWRVWFMRPFLPRDQPSIKLRYIMRLIPSCIKLKFTKILYLSTDIPFIVFVPLGWWFEGYKTVQQTIRNLAFQTRNNFIYSNKSIIVHFHNICRRENFGLQISSKDSVWTQNIYLWDKLKAHRQQWIL